MWRKKINIFLHFFTAWPMQVAFSTASSAWGCWKWGEIPIGQYFIVLCHIFLLSLLIFHQASNPGGKQDRLGQESSRVSCWGKTACRKVFDSVWANIDFDIWGDKKSWHIIFVGIPWPTLRQALALVSTLINLWWAFCRPSITMRDEIQILRGNNCNWRRG